MNLQYALIILPINWLRHFLIFREETPPYLLSYPLLRFVELFCGLWFMNQLCSSHYFLKIFTFSLFIFSMLCLQIRAEIFELLSKISSCLAWRLAQLSVNSQFGERPKLSCVFLKAVTQGKVCITSFVFCLMRSSWYAVKTKWK